MVYKKPFLALLGILLLAQRFLHAAQMDNKLSGQHDHAKKALTISDDKNFSGINFKGKRLPQDLSYANLTNADLTGHHFSHTNFTGATLNGVILTNTTCDYQQCFEDNIIKITNRNGPRWYSMQSLKDLKSIAQVYPQLCQDKHKVELLQIACGLGYLPYYENVEFFIKFQYWSCKLLLLKKQLGAMGDSLFCSLGSGFVYEVNNYCWKTDYPLYLEPLKGAQIAAQWCRSSMASLLPKALGELIQSYLTEPTQPIHLDFDQYLQLFQEGLVNYNVTSKEQYAYRYYKKTIEKNFQGLKKIYPKLSTQQLQKEAMDIAHQLSKKYKIQDLVFLSSFLNCQNRLIQLAISAGEGSKNDIHYNTMFGKY